MSAPAEGILQRCTCVTTCVPHCCVYAACSIEHIAQGDEDMQDIVSNSLPPGKPSKNLPIRTKNNEQHLRNKDCQYRSSQAPRYWILKTSIYNSVRKHGAKPCTHSTATQTLCVSVHEKMPIRRAQLPVQQAYGVMGTKVWACLYNYRYIYMCVCVCTSVYMYTCTYLCISTTLSTTIYNIYTSLFADLFVLPVYKFAHSF